MKFKFIFFTSFYTVILCCGCLSQRNLTISKEVFSEIDSNIIYKVTIKNNYSDSLVLIPLALKYKLGADTIHDIDFDINPESKIITFYLSIDKYTIGSLVKYYKLESKELVTFYISIKNEQKDYQYELKTLYYKFATSQLKTTERYIMYKPANSKLEEMNLTLSLRSK